MRVLRRIVFPILWLLLIAVIAAALVKLAFFDGIQQENAQLQPEAQIQAPVVAATVDTVTNTVELQGAVQEDPAVPVRVTAVGKVVYFFVNEGAQVAAGDQLFQIRSEVMPDPTEIVQPEAPAEGDEPAPPAAPPAPVYTYTDVLAPAAGTLNSLTVLLNQEVSVGDTAGSVLPGTFSIAGTLTTAQQFRLLDKPATAIGTVVNGPAPFSCQNVTLSSKEAAEDPAAPSDPMAGAMGPDSQSGGSGAGQVSCAVPADVRVFSGLGATITLTAGESQNVLTLPLTSVKGSVQKGLVWLPSEDGAGQPEEREVVLGLNDGVKVEIVSGLAEGESVLEFVPGADAPMPEDGQMAGFGRIGG
ncbi:multidrug efflux pump subunit AcrA (membrane-fusion protein) [Arthrobacter stackebrandtii]|uniref:Multidrug efflux pump subunit AcrA (Membrane-fusion protein) n=1 Tax=Arthrobacter stackebrandtii TaxID=272161 RepID=A0ABS4YS68_9MICC|nr:efflux RND transporter periplasmic adaptor subunit [Arthrobacter stackebrandtii]MBP2411639.1 multidrug efflux pump subunit AcrA (membrane-fusion protein) [Arthrobacter stackebrandtii]PYG99710.1 hypothetical protein CVV67_14310 [Arthrobacter stackebrandtii]